MAARLPLRRRSAPALRLSRSARAAPPASPAHGHGARRLPAAAAGGERGRADTGSWARHRERGSRGTGRPCCSWFGGSVGEKLKDEQHPPEAGQSRLRTCSRFLLLRGVQRGGRVLEAIIAITSSRHYPTSEMEAAGPKSYLTQGSVVLEKPLHHRRLLATCKIWFATQEVLFKADAPFRRHHRPGKNKSIFIQAFMGQQNT
ncbi:uncharacterized protein LOC117010778 [Catharus ustulatus]|uniref:uncharacterized protein LOC117010778 n=1 Tax=Catharus ustulatus TaxID=91951 RepID=UPI0014091667|nr:uncharacterized protein LOC117010778 [Catharus ustulatus]